MDIRDIDKKGIGCVHGGTFCSGCILAVVMGLLLWGLLIVCVIGTIQLFK